MTGDWLPIVLLEKCVKLYCDIWKEPPRNEFFWSPREVLVDMWRQFQKPGAGSFFAISVTGEPEELNYQERYDFKRKLAKADGLNVEIVGFSWGYLVSRGDLRDISGGDKLDHLFEIDQKIFYIDELGVGSSFRKRGIGELLTQKLIDYFRNQGANVITLRTERKAIAARALYQKLGFQELPIKDAKHQDRTYWKLVL
jgi:ribosomal protein S18 acetylase RimI-like enzyme